MIDMEQTKNRIDEIEAETRVSQGSSRILLKCVGELQERICELENVHVLPTHQHDKPAPETASKEDFCECGHKRDLHIGNIGKDNHCINYKCRCQSFKAKKETPREKFREGLRKCNQEKEEPFDLMGARERVRAILNAPGPVETLDEINRVLARLYHASFREGMKAVMEKVK